MNTKELKNKASKLRQDIIKTIYWAQSWHPWWSLSAIDLMVTLYYWWFLKFNAKEPKWNERDYFIMSKWHGSPAFYTVLSDLWYFLSEELFSFRQIDSLLQWHPVNKIPWVEVCSWSLWQWLSVAVWIALWLKTDWKNNTVWALCWDWELQEWQIWEALMSASHFWLWNLIMIVDHNWYQIDGSTKQIMDIWNIKSKLDSFWWETLEVDW
jgi:transketolase